MCISLADYKRSFSNITFEYHVHTNSMLLLLFKNKKKKVYYNYYFCLFARL